MRSQKGKQLLPEGSVLNGRYTIKEPLGEGGFSITYRAVHNEMGKNVAVKEFFARDYMYRDNRISKEVLLADPSDRTDLERDLQTFLGEARILAEMSSVRNVAHVMDYFRENGTAYIVMELIEGVSLEKRLQNGVQLTWEETVNRFLPVIDALAEVHKKGLIHRDIKPDNIIVSNDGDYILIDFGAALHYSDAEAHSVYLTEGYAPKEQYLRNGVLGPYTDVYAVCAVIYRCITGKIPEHSIQRAVFDELKAPSALGIGIPPEAESALMRGLNTEPEKRWQSMEELADALKSCFSKPGEKTNKFMFLLAGVIIALFATAAFYMITHNAEYRMHKMVSDGEAIVFRLDAPEEMTADEFEEAVRITEMRADAFAGESEHWIQKETSSMILTIPRECFALDGDWDTEILLETCFCFSGRWRLHNPDLTEFLDLKPGNIRDLELFYGSVPLVTRSGEPRFYSGKETDWSREEGYYLKMEFDEPSAEFLQEYLSREGYQFIAAARIAKPGTTITFHWISGGDGRTAYFYVGPKETQRFAETLYRIMSGKEFSHALQLTWEDESSIRWIAPAADDAYMRAAGELQSLTADIQCGPFSASRIDGALSLCQKQMALLEIPYAAGFMDEKIVVRVPADRINELILYSICGARMSIRTIWNQTVADTSDFEKAETGKTEDGGELLSITIPERYMKEAEEALQESPETLFLFLGDVRIGELCFSDHEKRCLQFRLLLPEEGEDVVPPDRMTEYLCTLASSGEAGWSYNTVVYRDGSKGLMSGKDMDPIPRGVTADRLTGLISSVRENGGEAVFSMDYCDEKLSIVFDNWTGSFPEEALEMIETIFRENGMSGNLCSRVAFEINSWHKGKPAEIYAEFGAEEESKSVICMSGSVTCLDPAVSERAENYIKKSAILTPSKDRFTDENSSGYRDSVWTYPKIYSY